MAKKTEPPAPALNLKCAQCDYENEAERVYCHNCGAKLDRSLLPKEEEGEKGEKAEEARRQIAKMANPNSGSALREIKTAINVLIYSALLAAVFLVSQKPDGVPEPSKGILERSVAGDLMDALDSAQPRRVDFTEAEVNSYLQQLLKPDGSFPEFKRAYVNLQPGVVCLGSEQSIFGLPVYSGVRYGVEIKDGKFTTTILGGNFGRLAVHPEAMKHLDTFFQKIGTALSRQRKQMDAMQKVIVQKGTIILVTKGGAAP